jgi:hypothetical protein
MNHSHNRRRFLVSAGISSALGPWLAQASSVLATEPTGDSEGQMDGYLGAPNERVDEGYGGGFSMYVAAWPLLKDYPGSRFQTGLFGTWMHAKLDGPEPKERLYSDIEGGLGWWRDTRFATTTPKFIMGGVALNFREWANGPGAGKGRDWQKPSGKYGVAQLSPWVLWPPDGLNLMQGTCGELFGYGYLPLPLTDPKAITNGKEVQTGNHCWTLFLNTANFKGPVAFFTPHFFSNVTADRPELAGLFLDSRPSDPNRALQMETQYIPGVVARDEQGKSFARIAPTRFPTNADGNAVLIHRTLSYRKAALWDAVDRWFQGGPEASGRIDAQQSVAHRFTGKGWSTWRIYTPDVDKDQRVSVDWPSLATPYTENSETFGFQWNKQLRGSQPETDPLFTLPEFYVLDGEGKSARWRPVAENEQGIPESLRRPIVPDTAEDSEPYVTPEDGCWSNPGPVAGPYQVQLGDGSTVKYHWYRFADQPALQNADLTVEERERLQQRVEKIHRVWTKERDYLLPPETGKLASLDPAVLVQPPSGMEFGYVPIVTWQGKAST